MMSGTCDGGVVDEERVGVLAVLAEALAVVGRRTSTVSSQAPAAFSHATSRPTTWSVYAISPR